MEGLELNRRYIHITGKLEVEKELSQGQDIDVTVSIYGIDDRDNQDGTYDRTYKGKLFYVHESE